MGSEALGSSVSNIRDQTIRMPNNRFKDGL